MSAPGRAYYNEIDPFCAAWLRNLIAAGLIAPGDVDERSIEDVRPQDLLGYAQCHFFAGIGVWSYALRQAGWPDTKPVWTGSCPCQPFSGAGKRKGFKDKRHLWPAWFRLVCAFRPVVVLGEQVANAGGLAWFDLVQADLENAGYACGVVDLCAAGIGAPHIRQRLYFVANSGSHKFSPGWTSKKSDWAQEESSGLGDVGFLAHSSSQRTKLERAAFAGGDRQKVGIPGEDGQVGFLAKPQAGGLQAGGRNTGSENQAGGRRPDFKRCGEPRLLGYAVSPGLAQRPLAALQQKALRVQGAALGAAEPVRGFWKGADWLYCRDGKYRPVRPGSFPLAHGAPARVGRLRAYGNALCAEAAKEFVIACREAGI